MQRKSIYTVWWILLLFILSFLFHAFLIQRPDTLPQLKNQLQALHNSYFTQNELSGLQSESFISQGSSVIKVNKIEILHSEENIESVNNTNSDYLRKFMQEFQEDATNQTIKNDESENRKISKKAWELLPHRGNKRKQQVYAAEEVTNVTWTEEISKAREAVYKDRAAHVKRGCHDLMQDGLYQTLLNVVHTNIRWDDHHNLAWCPIFKAASTTWVKNFLILSGEMKLKSSLHGVVDDVFAAPKSKKQRTLQLKKSLKMLIVRHPLDRLLSAYRDKMLRYRNPGDSYLGLQVCLVEKYPNLGPNDPDRSNTTAKSCKTFMNEELKKEMKESHGNITHPTFTQFLLKVRDDLRSWKNPNKSNVNLHWRPYWLQCGPCQVNYDVIMHTESLDLDNEYIIHKAGLEGIIFNAHTHASKFDAYNDTSESTKAYYSQVPPWLLNDIIEFYQPDLTIFGYSAQPYLDIVNSRH